MPPGPPNDISARHQRRPPDMARPRRPGPRLRGPSARASLATALTAAGGAGSRPWPCPAVARVPLLPLMRRAMARKRRVGGPTRRPPRAGPAVGRTDPRFPVIALPAMLGLSSDVGAVCVPEGSRMVPSVRCKVHSFPLRRQPPLADIVPPPIYAEGPPCGQVVHIRPRARGYLARSHQPPRRIGLSLPRRSSCPGIDVAGA